MNKKKILFVCGSMNQTTQMHKISKELPEFDAYFTPYFATGGLNLMSKLKLLEYTILGSEYKLNTLKYLKQNNLKLDYRGRNDDYDLVIIAMDIAIPRNIEKFKIILVQEGMIDPIDWRYHVTKLLHLPRWCVSTSMTGLSHQYNIFCVASEGFRDQFIERGVNPEKIRVTGIPNFDDINKLKDLMFEHKNFVLVATSDIRETLKYENRKKFVQFALKIANGRKLIFKLHPNENVKRRTKEINKYAPDALVYHGVSIDPLLANCDVLITRFSSTVFPAIILEKEVYCDLSKSELKKLAPLQNNGKSARNIAELAKQLLSSSDSTARIKKRGPEQNNNLKHIFRRKIAQTNS